jgi:hypothetical protein
VARIVDGVAVENEDFNVHLVPRPDIAIYI